MEKTKVTWTSQSMGVEKEKTGTVIAIIPANTSAMAHVPSDAKTSYIKFKDISLMDRVLVAVPAGKDRQISHYYCPAKSVLEEQGNIL